LFIKILQKETNKNNFMENKKILEILVDKNNEKGPGVFEHILIVLHRVFDDFSEKKIFKKEGSQPTFSFEITKI